MGQEKVTTVDQYINMYGDDKKDILEKTRAVIRQAAPDAKEKISWQMPTYHQKENLIHFAKHKHHLGVYPGAEAMVAFADRFEGYKTSKGAVQFPFAEPIPYDLIAEITRYRVKNVEGK